VKRENVAQPTALTIGEVAAVTGIKPGRIRHYEAKGLIDLDYRTSGYRSFGATEVLRLLCIDLLRRSGMGLEQIRISLSAGPDDLRSVLEAHAALLRAERRRLDRVLEAVEGALESPGPDVGGDGLLEQLIAVQRDSLGVFGRLAAPLSSTAQETLGRLLTEGWDVPVPPLFGQMLLPEPVTALLEELARAEGHTELFDRLRHLTAHIVALGASRDPAVAGTAERLGTDWVRHQLNDPLPPAVAQVLRETGRALVDLPVIRDGFPLWASAISPAAATVLSAMAIEAKRQGVDIVGALVIPPEEPRPQRRSSVARRPVKRFS
jgi:DNA-binding transcriptional MerR regulator